jgi:phosphopantetheine--protein transferase-like protein
MVMSSSTWTSKIQGKPVGCGVDLETVDRFRGALENDAHPIPFVFTKNEIDHALAQHDTALALSACFTAKEAVQKALRAPYNFTECELFPVFVREGNAFEGELVLSPSLKQAYQLSGARVRCSFNREVEGEILTTAILFKEEKP